MSRKNSRIRIMKIGSVTHAHKAFILVKLSIDALLIVLSGQLISLEN